MILNISNSGAIYEAQVTKQVWRGKHCYNFTLLRCDGIVDYYDSTYNFYKFSCSLQCRLKHYKDFKLGIFNGSYTPKKFKTITDS